MKTQLKCWRRKNKKGKPYTICNQRKPRQVPWYLRQNQQPNRRNKRKVVTPARYL